MALRPSVVGAVTGGVLGGVARAAVGALHVHEISQTTFPGLFAIGVLGLVIGGLAGLTGRPLLGATVGLVLTGLAYLVTYPITLLFHALGALTPPPVLEILVAGGLSGALGAAAGLFAQRRAGRRSGDR